MARSKEFLQSLNAEKVKKSGGSRGKVQQKVQRKRRFSENLRKNGVMVHDGGPQSSNSLTQSSEPHRPQLTPKFVPHVVSKEAFLSSCVCLLLFFYSISFQFQLPLVPSGSYSVFQRPCSFRRLYPIFASFYSSTVWLVYHVGSLRFFSTSYIHTLLFTSAFHNGF